MSRTNGKLPLRTRWMLGRAYLSIPGLLSICDEKRIVSLVTAVNAALSILAIGLFAWLTDLPLLFPALGPTAFILFSSPMHPTAAPRNVILGHLIGLTCGYGTYKLAVLLTGTPVVHDSDLLVVCASAIVALSACSVLMIQLSCPHPPACASSLVMLLGGVATLENVLLMVLVVIWLAYQAVGMNRLAGLTLPLWAPFDRERGGSPGRRT